jgi:DNA polymerase III subunit delta'
MIFGHDPTERAFLDAMHGPRTPHAWIFAGPQGVGKAALAQRWARRLLVEAADPGAADSPDHPIAKLVEARSHPDLLVLERLAKDAKTIKDLDFRDWPEDLERARSITVDQIRTLNAAFALKPALSSRRLVIVDSVDDLERGGANALLKTLEEPPAGTIFMLISHAPGRLLPTIRSRCRMLRFSALADDVMAAALKSKLPAVGTSEIAALVAQGDGAPGRALALAGLAMDEVAQTLGRIAARGDGDNRERLALAQAFSLKAAQKRYEAFLSLAPAFIAAQARQRDGSERGEALKTWEQARDLAGHAVPGSLDPHAVTVALCALVASLAPRGTAAKA